MDFSKNPNKLFILVVFKKKNKVDTSLIIVIFHGRRKIGIISVTEMMLQIIQEPLTEQVEHINRSYFRLESIL